MNKHEEKEVNRLNSLLRVKRYQNGMKYLVGEIQNEKDKRKPEDRFALYRLIPENARSNSGVVYHKRVVVSTIEIETISDNIDEFIKF